MSTPNVRATGLVRVALVVPAIVILAASSSGTLARTVVRSSAAGVAATSALAQAPAVIVTRADRIRVTLGFPKAARQNARNLHAKPGGGDLDEVDGLDAKSRLLWAIAFDTRGSFRSAVRLDQPARGTARAAEAQAIAAAQKAARSVGLKDGKPDRVVDDAATGGWIVVWDRIADGIVVRGDETRIGVWPDGRVALVTTQTHPLAPRPHTILDRPGVVAIVEADLDARVDPAWRPYLAIVRAELQWVGPQQSADREVETEQPYVLAWVVDVRASGPTAEFVRQLTLTVSAGNGALLGSDVVE